jgi:hypothetical protein
MADGDQPSAIGHPPSAIRRNVRFALVHLLQFPSVALVVFSDQPTAWWAAAIWGSLVCCAGTDSGWRWRNRLLVLEAIAWLVLAACFG